MHTTNHFPGYIELFELGWECNHPHGPDDITAEYAVPPQHVAAWAIDHLDEHHPDWRTK